MISQVTSASTTSGLGLGSPTGGAGATQTSEAEINGAPGAPGSPDNQASLSWSIAAVERDIGVGKDTLRVWERRYGFPQPTRDAQGERRYPEEQLQRLRKIKRLLDSGQRPRRVVGLPLAELDALLQAGPGPSHAAAVPGRSDWEFELQWIRGHDAALLRNELSRAASRLGLSGFVVDVVAPLTVEVGEAWRCGRLAIHEEHKYTEAVAAVLRQALGALPDPGREARPHVLLTTLPGEPHGLGLLMAEAMLALAGCRCTSLGVQTPVRDIIAAVHAQRCDIVGLSFSACSTVSAVRDGLTELRALLPETVALWAGGSAVALRRRAWPGIDVLASLGEIGYAVDRWRSG